jgi:BlaI family penicillinase repressor
MTKTPRATQELPRISDAEWMVMHVVWQRARASTNEVVEALRPPATAWKPKTVMTLLKRLVDKGALGYERKGRTYEFFPLVDEAECKRAETRSFLQRVYGGSLRPMLASFVEEKALSKREIEELRAILERKGK